MYNQPHDYVRDRIKSQAFVFAGQVKLASIFLLFSFSRIFHIIISQVLQQKCRFVYIARTSFSSSPMEVTFYTGAVHVI